MSKFLDNTIREESNKSILLLHLTAQKIIEFDREYAQALRDELDMQLEFKQDDIRQTYIDFSGVSDGRS